MNPKRVVPVVVLVALGGWALYHFAIAGRSSNGDLLASGTVEATDAQLGFQVPGRLAEITLREGDHATAGQVVARLDATEIGARRAQAAAALAVARAQLAELEAGSRREEVAQGRAQLGASRERVADAERDRDRVRTLFEGRAVSREALDKAELAVQLAAAQRDQATEQLQLLERGPRHERIDAARAQVAAAEAALAGLDALLDQHTLRAPFAGLVTVRHREPGEIVPAGAAVVTLLDPGDRWVRIYVPENRLAAVQIGQKAVIRSDTFPGRSYEGEVSFVASEAEFTPKNVQTQEERVRLVYAVKVRVTGDPGFELKPGLPADVELREGGS